MGLGGHVPGRNCFQHWERFIHLLRIGRLGKTRCLILILILPLRGILIRIHRIAITSLHTSCDVLCDLLCGSCRKPTPLNQDRLRLYGVHRRAYHLVCRIHN